MVGRPRDHHPSVGRRDDQARALRHLPLGIAEEIRHETAQEGERGGDDGTFGHRRNGGWNQGGADEWVACAIDLHTGRMPYKEEEGQWPERALGKSAVRRLALLLKKERWAKLSDALRATARRRRHGVEGCSPSGLSGAVFLFSA